MLKNDNYGHFGQTLKIPLCVPSFIIAKSLILVRSVGGVTNCQLPHQYLAKIH